MNKNEIKSAVSGIVAYDEIPTEEPIIYHRLFAGRYEQDSEHGNKSRQLLIIYNLKGDVIYFKDEGWMMRSVDKDYWNSVRLPNVFITVEHYKELIKTHT